MHDLGTIQRMNAEAVAQKFNDWRDTIDLTVVRKWYLWLPGDTGPHDEISDDYEGVQLILAKHYKDPWDLILIPGEINE